MCTEAAKHDHVHILQWAAERGACINKRHPSDADDDSAWIRRVMSPLAMQRALARMRPRGQAAGVDGWPGVLLRWAPLRVQMVYLEQLRRAAASLVFPAEWPVNLVTHIPKPGKSVTDVTKMRDLWNCPHGWKICTQCLREQ